MPSYDGSSTSNTFPPSFEDQMTLKPADVNRPTCSNKVMHPGLGLHLGDLQCKNLNENAAFDYMRKTGKQLTKDTVQQFLLCPTAACSGDQCSCGADCVSAGKQCCPKDYEINRWGQCVEPNRRWVTKPVVTVAPTIEPTISSGNVADHSSVSQQCNEPNRVVYINNKAKMLSSEQICSMKSMGLL